MYVRLVWVAVGLLFAWPFAGVLAGVDERVVVGSELVAVTAFVLAIDADWWWRLAVRERPRPPARSRWGRSGSRSSSCRS